MEQENKKLLLIDLSARLPYHPILNWKFIDNTSKDEELKELSDLYIWCITKAQDCEVKPHLRPMSSMTEEEAKEIAILHDIKDILSVKVASDYIDVVVDDGVCSTWRKTIWYGEIVSSVKCFDFLTAHHFDYRGLFEKGLAISVTEENNPYK